MTKENKMESPLNWEEELLDELHEELAKYNRGEAFVVNIIIDKDGPKLLTNVQNEWVVVDILNTVAKEIIDSLDDEEVLH